MEPKKHRILDLFSGTGSATQVFRDRTDCLVIDVDMDPLREPIYACDIEQFYEWELKSFNRVTLTSFGRLHHASTSRLPISTYQRIGGGPIPTALKFLRP